MTEVLKHNWIMRMSEAMQLSHPEYSPQEIEEIVAKTYKERVKNTPAKLYNNYENIVAGTSLIDMVDWITNRKPLVAESGVFFFPKNEKRNINIEIIKEHMLDARTVHKKEKFEAMKAGDTFLAAVKDSQQSNDKKAANSGYGAEGQSSSFLYNIHSAMSVTASGRGQISTACQCFENFLADSVKFYSMNEFYTFVYNIIHEKLDWVFDTFDVCKRVPTKAQFVNRFMNKFGHESLANRQQVEAVYNNLDDEMKIRVFYKANIRDFFKLRKPADMFADIACSDVEFIDPNDIPEELKKPIKQLTDLVAEFVLYKYGVFRYEDRSRYLRREAAIVMDTDS